MVRIFQENSGKMLSEQATLKVEERVKSTHLFAK
jgi:hypothetical protein